MIKKFDPFDSIFDDFMRPMRRPPFMFGDPLFPPMPSHEFKPCKTDIVEFEDRVEINAELPGYKKEDISVSLDKNNMLRIRAKRENKTEEKEEGRVIRKEIYSGSIERVYPTVGLDTNKIKASFKDGILKLTLPKLEDKEEIKKIDIE
jgi:HSP20 family protein